ncbi:MAG: nuclease (SNase) [Alphaproteobacteria bacterium]|nr:MAG: nuclease (SNase) [Alphaproteobacteria bacterium]
MHRIFTLMLALFFMTSLAQAQQAELKKSITQQVVRVIDGDTVILKDKTRVRLVGIQAPKLPLGRKGHTEWPLGTASKEFLSRLVLNKEVTLYYGGQRRDRYGRALAHLFLKDGLWIQGEILKAGMARVYSFPDNRAIVPAMLAQERLARQNRRGIWALSYYDPKDHRQAAKYTNSFQLVKGVVRDVAKVRNTYYLNFGRDWKKDFTIVIKSRAARKFIKAGQNPESYLGKKIEIRGWLKFYNGPMIEATHPEQITIIQ